MNRQGPIAPPVDARADYPLEGATANRCIYLHRVSYLFNGQPRSHEFEHDNAEFLPEMAAMRLMALHYGDAENSLLIPAADAPADQILDQAHIMGITALEIQGPGRVVV